METLYFITYQRVLMFLCVAGAALTIAFIAFMVLRPYIEQALDQAKRPESKVLMLLAVAMLTMYAGSKHIIGTVTYPRTDPETWYLMDNGSYVTNGAVHAAFSKNLIVPDTASIFIDGLELKYTNVTDWADHSFTAYSNTFDQITVPFDFSYPAATNFNWIIYTDWTPPPVVHTNGIAFVVWQKDFAQGTNNFAMTRTGVYVNGIRLAPNPAITNAPASASGLSIINAHEENE